MKRIQLLRYAGIAGLALSTLVHPPVWAARETPAEIAMLPPYCDAKMGSQSPEAVAYWRARLGHENWIHIHHYCGGLASLNRYYRQSGANRDGSLRNALWEFNYVLDHTGPSFTMRADLYYNRGKVLQLQGKDGAALADLAKALELNPAMPAASIELASLYRKVGKKGLALGVLKAALEKSPEHKGLRRNYQEMGGDLAAISDKPPAEVAAPVEAAAKASQADTASSKSPEPAPSTPSVSEQKIGNQTNPWCRFCPDPAAEPSKPEPK